MDDVTACSVSQLCLDAWQLNLISSFRIDENAELLMTITGSRDPSTRIIACCLYFALPTHIKNILMHTAHAHSFYDCESIGGRGSATIFDRAKCKQQKQPILIVIRF